MRVERAHVEPGSPQALTLILAAGLPVMGSVLLSPAVPRMLSVFTPQGVAPYVVMMALVAPAGCIGLLSPIIGPVVDRVGRRKTLVVALASYGFLGMAPLLLTNILAIVIVRFALGVTEAAILTANLTLLGDYFHGAERIKWLAIQSSALPIFGSLFFVFGGVLSGISWRGAFGAYGGSFVILWLAKRVLFEVPPTESAGTPDRHPEPGARPASFVLICGITVVSLTLFFIVPIQFALLLSADTAVPTTRLGLAMAVTALGNAAGAYSFRYMSRVSTYALLGVAFVVGAAGLMGASASASMIAMTAGGFLNQVGCGVVVPALASATLTVLPAASRGAGSGRWWSCFYIGNFLSPMAVVYVIQCAGGVRRGFAWLSLVNLSFGAVMILLYVCSRTRRA